jgi:4-hydroxy-tetrahydrodipicolinate synthase
MSSVEALEGVLPSMLTPFDGAGRVDAAAFERHVSLMVSAGVGGLIVASTLGEGPVLHTEEKLELVRRASALARPAGLPVIAACVGHGLTRDRRLLAALGQHGADALLLFPPVLYRPSADEFVAHVRGAIQCAGLPTLVFNKPASFGCDFSPRLAERLADEPGWIGVKEAAELTARIPEWKAAYGARCRVFAGDEWSFEALGLGADGFVAGLANAVPHECVAFHRAFAGQRVDEAARRYRRLAPLFQLDVSPALVQNIKLAARIATGFPESFRPPRLPLTGAERARVEAIVAQALAQPAGRA